MGVDGAPHVAGVEVEAKQLEAAGP
jgi:hypothetical protein